MFCIFMNSQMTQLATSHPLAAPTGCLQYFMDVRGTIESFNYQDASSIAIARNPSYLVIVILLLLL